MSRKSPTENHYPLKREGPKSHRGGAAVALVSMLPPPMGGVTIHVARLAARLKENEWTVYCVDPVRSQPTHDIVACRKNPFKLLSALREIRGKGVKIFHFHSSKRAIPFLLCAPFLKIWGGSTVLSIHYGGFGERISGNSLQIRLLRAALRLADRIVVMNAEEQAVLHRLFPEMTERIICIHPFIYPIPPKPVIMQKGEVLRVTAMGLWKSFYAYEEVLEAVVRLRDDFSLEVELDLVVSTAGMGQRHTGADEKYRSKIMQQVELLQGRGHQVQVSEDLSDVLAYLETRDVLVRTSRVDSFGMCVAEALLVGTFAIATNVCARPDGTFLYEPGKGGQLVDLLQKIYQMKRSAIKEGPLLPAEADAYLALQQLYCELL